MGSFHSCTSKINSGPLRWCNLTNQSLTKAKANSPLTQERVLYFGVCNRSHRVSLMFSKDLERGGIGHIGKPELWRFTPQYTSLEDMKEAGFTFTCNLLQKHGGYFLSYQTLQTDNGVQAFLRNNLQETALHST